jgi:hypothetical protein
MWLNRPEVAAIIGSEARQLSGGAVGPTGSANDSADLPRVAVIGPAQGRSHVAARQMASKGTVRLRSVHPGGTVSSAEDLLASMSAPDPQDPLEAMSSMTSGAEVGVLMVRRPR